MRSKNKLYAQGDKELSNRIRDRSRSRPKTDEERQIIHRQREAKQDAKKKMAQANLDKPTETTQKYFKDYGV